MQAPPEDRHGIAGERHAHHAMVEDRVSLRTAAMMPAGSPSTRAKMMAQSASSMVAGNSVENSLQHRLLGDIDLPRSPLQDAGQIDPVLDDERLVEAVFLAELRVAGGIDAALAGKRFDGIARHEADQEEGQQRDPDEGRDDQADAGRE